MYHYIFSYKNAFKSCLCFDPSAPVGSRISRIADMNYARMTSSLIVANEKLYAIGGWAEILQIFIRNICKFRFHRSSSGMIFCNSIEEYDPQANKWRKVGKFVEPIESDIEISRKLNKLCPQIKKINPGESSEVIRLFTISDIIREIEKRQNLEI